MPIIGMLFLMVLKLEHFHLPFYWDESWSYGKAVAVMVEHGPSLNPASVDQEVFRGHPLFFYFLTSAVGSLFGFTPVVMHSFMFLLSMGLLVWYAYIMSQWFGQRVSVIASILICSNQMFGVQSSFLLPEVLIGFLCVITIFYFLQNNFIGYFLCGSALILTKESAVVLFGVLGLYFVVSALREKINFKRFVQSGLFYAAPILTFVLFLGVQKIKWGWFLFPEHVSMMDLSWGVVKSKTIVFYKTLFYFNENLYFLLLVFAALLLRTFGFRQKLSLTKKQKNVLFIIALFVVGYTYFSAINFYTVRYLLSLLFMLLIPISLMVGSVQLPKYFHEFGVVLFISYSIFFLQLKPYYQTAESGDCSWGYAAAVKVRSELISQAVTDYPTKSFFADFLMGTNMKDHRLGYVSKNQKPKVVEFDQGEMILLSKIEENAWYAGGLKDTNQFERVLRMEEQFFWGELYRRK